MTNSDCPGTKPEIPPIAEEPRKLDCEQSDNLRHSIGVSFIIPALNEEKHIGRCIDAILRLEPGRELGERELIVVDNQSTDRTAEISRARGALVLQVPPGHPSRARNAGARAARGDLLAFVDADCELAFDWLVACGEHLLRNPEIVAAAGGVQAPVDDATWVERAWHELAYASDQEQPKPVRWLPTFNLLVRRSAFESVQGFDESLATCEDCALGYRLDELGTLVLDARTKAAHLGESKSLKQLFCREAWRSRGNLRLAMMRPVDWKNWLSLLMPLALVGCALITSLGIIVALAIEATVWPWIGGLALTIAMTIALVIRKATATNLPDFFKQTLVFMTYLAGRAAGLVWAFRRVER